LNKTAHKDVRPAWNARVIRRLVFALLYTHACAAQAAEPAGYPHKPIRFIVPYPPGGGNDFVARVIAPRLAEKLRQPVVIDNRGGAHGIIATDITAKSPPDGHTILLGGTGHAINPVVYGKLPYDSDKDFAPVSLAAVAPNLLVLHPSVAATSARELIALAKARPQQLHYGSVGGGGNSHLAAELFRLRAQIEIVHVAYRGTGPAAMALLAGEVQMMFSTMPPVLAQVRAGRLRALAVTGARRAAAVPDVPTVAESGLAGYEATGWWGILAPAGTPQNIVTALNAAVVTILNTDNARAQLLNEGIEAAGGSPQQFAAHIQAERRKWAAVIREANITVE
jgi:tripartite-type tricarboxylate transporter receptor subunit TctC